MKQALAIVAIVLALRLPFLHQAIQGDDLYYLYGAEHAQIEPLHPDHARYLFMGDLVEMRGHSHPPLNSWILGGLLAAFGDVREVPYHLAYSLFSIIAALAMLSIARRFCKCPFLATLLFIAVPTFVVNGNSLESDLPFLALWMTTIALFVWGVEENSVVALIGSAFAAAIAALAAYQAVFLVPILAVYLLYRRNRSVLAWCAVLAAPAAIAAWQIFGRLTSGAMPAAVLAGYMQKYGWQASVAQKVKNAVALIGHAAWITSPLLARGRTWNWVLGALAAIGAAFYDLHPLFWVSIGCGAVILCSCFRKDFLANWVLIFFACGLIVFFAGSARYLLPIAAPLAILAVRQCSRGWVLGAFVLQMTLSLGLAIVNDQHWGTYREFAESLAPEAARHRVWIDGDHGLRFYLESEGALPVPKGQEFLPGEVLVRSEISDPNPPRAALAPISQIEIRPRIPLRMFSMERRSAYSVAQQGLRPFDISLAPIDRVSAGLVIERKPELTWLTPHDQEQVIGGLYVDGWMSSEAKVLVKRGSGPLYAEFYIPAMAPARHVRLLVDGRLAAEETFPGPGRYSLSANAEGGTVTLAVDKTFPAPAPDTRELGIIVIGIGFKP